MQPFLKHVGTVKYQLKQITSELPDTYGAFYSLFTGDSALLLAERPQNPVIVSPDRSVIEIYATVRDSCEELISVLKTIDNNPTTYNKITRINKCQSMYSKLTSVQKSAIRLYMYNTSASCKFHVYSHGGVRVKSGHAQKTLSKNWFNESALRQASEYFNTVGAKFIRDTTNQIEPKEGDFVFLTPPPMFYGGEKHVYYESMRSSVTFGYHEQLDLLHYCNRLTRQGVKLIMINSNALLVTEWYKRYNIKQFDKLRVLIKNF